jgi:hypothetical protein
MCTFSKHYKEGKGINKVDYENKVEVIEFET